MKKLILGLMMAFAANAVMAEEDTRDYLSFTAKGGDVKVSMVRGSDYHEPPKRELETSFDRTVWTPFEPGESYVTVSAGRTLYFRRPIEHGVITSFASSENRYSRWKFAFDTGAGDGAKVEAGGNVMSLLDGTCALTTVGDNAFYDLFNGCEALTTAPALPATTLATNCYRYMFKSCVSLTNAPALPATTLAEYCYGYMFHGCDALTVAPTLPAEKLAKECYHSMFSGCVALTAAPVLPATELAEGCYYSMFESCDALTVAPTLPAEKLAKECYRCMFLGCDALTAAPVLPATELAEGCYHSMFESCDALTVAPDLPARTLVKECYYEMFDGCENLTVITVAFSAWGDSALDATDDWVCDVATSGTFNCPKDLPRNYGEYFIPEGWTVNEGDCYVSIPTVEHLTVRVSVDGVTIPPEEYDAGCRYSVFKGETATVTFGVDDEDKYELIGKSQVVIVDIEQDVVFGTTEGYPLPQVLPPVDKWGAGDGVTASLFRTGLLKIAGKGKMDDFQDAASVPWAAVADDVTAVMVEEGVTPGKNALAGLSDGVLVEFPATSTSIGSMKEVTGASEPPIPADKVLVSKEELQAAKAESVTVDNGVVTLAVGVSSNANFTAETKDWKPVELNSGNVKVEDGKVVISIPVDSASGFMILQSGDAKIAPVGK